MHFDRKNVKASIMAIANPKKAEAKIKAQKAEEAARANIWNFLNQFVDDN